MTLRRLLAALGALTGVGVAAVAMCALAPVSEQEEPVAVEIPAGATLGEIARQLEVAGVVRRAWAFEALARWHGLGEGLRAGEYDLAPSLSASQILQRIAEGQVRTYRVSIPEGFTAAEIAARLERRGLASAEEFLRVAMEPGSSEALGVEGGNLEGYLFPETYQLARGLSAMEIAQTLVAEFRKAWEEIEPDAQALGLSMAETVTLASLVEKETGVPEERPLIAAVFHTRLRRGMRLEADPAVIYGIPDFDGNLRRVHLEDESNPYNTYRFAGLPPGPIANPGRGALRAVVHPAESKWLYFVSRNDGTHQFSRTYEEHLRAVNHHQRKRGRSETDRGEAARRGSESSEVGQPAD